MVCSQAGEKMANHRAVLVAGALLVLVSAVPADAGRLGGAFRGYWPAPGGGLGGPVGPGRRAAPEDIAAYWPYFFEHEKERLLADRLRALRAEIRRPAQSSVKYFREWRVRELRLVTGALKTGRVLPLLATALRDEHPWVRDGAILALGKLGGPGAVPHLVRRLHDTDLELREDALLALGLTGEKAALAPLLGALRGRDVNRKAFAALGLALLGDPHARETLGEEFAALVRGGRWGWEAAGSVALALAALAEPGDRLARRLGQAWLEKKNPVFGTYVGCALGRLGGDRSAVAWLTRMLDSKDRAAARAATLAMGQAGDAGALTALLGTDGLKSARRMVVLYSLASVAELAARLDPGRPLCRKAIGELVAAACKPQRDKYRAMHASLHLGLAGDRSANGFFLEQLDRVNRTRFCDANHSAMALALGFTGDRRAATDLREILGGRSYGPDYRGYAAMALGLLPDPGSLDALRSTLAGPRVPPEVLRGGCWALALLGDGSDVPLLTSILRREPADPDFHHARGAAAIALGLLGDAAGLEILAKVVESEEPPSTRAFALAAIGWIVDRDEVPRIPLLFSRFDYRRTSPIMRKVMTTL
jgi:HEAT repeat protein